MFYLLFSKNLVVHVCYYKWLILIGYATRYLFVNRYRVTRQAEFFVKLAVIGRFSGKEFHTP